MARSRPLTPDEALVVRAEVLGYDRDDAAALLMMSRRERDEVVGGLCRRFDAGFGRVCDLCVEMGLIPVEGAAHV